MHYFKITTYKNNKTLYEGRFRDFKSCLEYAAKDGIALKYADLSRQDLRGANLDGADFEGADFSYSNLSGTNLAEANLKAAILKHSDLYNTCFAESSLEHCAFHHTQFGGTLIFDADLSFAQFSGTSCFSLNFIEARSLDGCTYKLNDMRITPMHSPPVILHGLSPHPIIFLDEFILTGDGAYPRSDWLAVFEASRGRLA